MPLAPELHRYLAPTLEKLEDDYLAGLEKLQANSQRIHRDMCELTPMTLFQPSEHKNGCFSTPNLPSKYLSKLLL